MEFNMKNIEVRDPISLYNELDKLVRFGDDHATIKAEKDGVTGYYLGGLLINDIKKSSISSETIGNLYSAIRNNEIRYGVLPHDVRKGQIPLILDDHSRSYFRNNLKELIEDGNLAWRMFFVPIKEQQTDDELFSAEILIDEEDDEQTYVAVSYDEVEEYLNTLLDVEGEDIDLSYLTNTTNNENESTETNEHIENMEVSEIDDNSHIDNLSFDDEEDDNIEDNTAGEPDNKEESVVEERTDDEIDSDDTSDLPLVEKQENTELVPDIDESESTQKEPMTNEYTMIPQELDSILNSFNLRRFEAFDNLESEDSTHVVLQKEIKNANQVVNELEQNIIRKAKQLYFQYMDQSYEKINQVIDVEQGDDIVKNKHNEALEKQKDLDVALTQNIENEKQKLEEKFWNEDYNIYKEQILAGLKLQFEKEEYYNLVAEPLERFKEQEKHRIEEQKYEITHELSNWFDVIKDQAIMTDRNNAIIEVQKYLDTSMKKVQSEVHKLDSKMQNQNERFIQYEIGKKAEERLRETVGSDLYTDEQAKKYKKQYETMEKKAEDLTEELKQLNAKYQVDIETKDEEYTKIKDDIENNHQEILASKDKELSELSKTVSELQIKNQNNMEQLDNSQKNTKKKVIRTGIGAFALSALIFGGTAIGIHQQGKGIEDELDAQSKAAEQHKAETSKTKDELDKLKKEKAEDHNKQQQIIDKQKKELEDKKKKDKKDKK